MSEKFSIFGFGRDGIPCFFRQRFSNGGDIAVDEHIWRTADQSDDAKIVSLVLDEWHGEPERRLRAKAMVSGLVSPFSRVPLPSAKLREALGLPPRLNKWREFLEAAGREAFAQALTILRDHPIPVDADEKARATAVANALSKLIERVDSGKWVLSVNALSDASGQLWELVDGDTLEQIAPAAEADTVRAKVSRSVIAGGKKREDGSVELGWRDYPEFRHIVKEVGGHLALHLRTCEALSDKDIREAAKKVPASYILEFVGEIPTVWGARPSRVARASDSLFDIKPVGIS